MQLFSLNNLFLLLTGLAAIYLLGLFFQRYQKQKKLYDIYYMLGFGVLLVSGLLLIFLGMGILKAPLVLTVASLIPLGIALGVANQYYPGWKKYFAWFALVGFLAIAISSLAGLAGLKKIAVPVFHGVAGLVIVLGPLFAKKAKPGFWWVSVGGALIGAGGIALAFLSAGRQFLVFSEAVVSAVLSPLLLLMALAFLWGFKKDCC